MTEEVLMKSLPKTGDYKVFIFDYCGCEYKVALKPNDPKSAAIEGKNHEPPTFNVLRSTGEDWIVEVTQGKEDWRLMIPKDPWFTDKACKRTGLNLVFGGHYQ
jgi:hypothetical protein